MIRVHPVPRCVRCGVLILGVFIMAKRVAGICYIKVDGEQLEVSGGVDQ